MSRRLLYLNSAYACARERGGGRERERERVCVCVSRGWVMVDGCARTCVRVHGV